MRDTSLDERGSDTSADLMLGLNAFILLLTLLMLPLIPEMILRSETKGERTIVQDAPKDSLETLVFTLGSKQVEPFLLHKGGITYGPIPRKKVGLDKLFSDQGILAAIKKHADENLPIALLIDHGAGETAFLFDSFLGQNQVGQTYRVYLQDICDFVGLGSPQKNCDTLQ